MKDKIFAIYKKLFSNDDIVIKIKKSSLTSFVIGFVFAAPIFIGASWLIGAGQAQVDTADEPIVIEDPGEDTNQPVGIQLRGDDYVLGNKDAKVTLVVFSDLQCPYCSKHHSTVNSLVEKYGNDIRVIWRHFPLSFHEYAADASLAAECAGEQGKFWAYLNAAFENQTNFGDELWAELAKDLDLNVSEFDKCVSGNKYGDKVLTDIKQGSENGVQGTPATFVNDVLISGAQPIEVFEAEIDKLLE